ncbi:diguanylate phosphodiesterase [Spirochaetia bacterium]|nr:diguanylate phosphodiesterase [Spirochaetia bacterium]GHV49318.1 diguanylate phosphodiesterase [Spirochaetia bacterium]
MYTKKLTAAVLMALLASTVLFAGPKKETGPKEAAEMRYGLTSEPATLDPLSPSNTADGRSILFNVFEGLVKPDTDGNLQPAIAESWTIEQNGLVYNFTLRQGVLFHDGSAVTVEDVEFTLNKAIENKYVGFTQIEKVETTGGRNIKITLKAPDPEFLPFLTQGIVPAHNEDREKNPVGSGPFMIESYTTQQSLVLVKNPRYWKQGFPKLDKVTVVFVADTDALLLNLQGGNIDSATLTGSQLEQLDPGRFDIVQGNSNSVQILALNNAVKPLDDIRVRQAVNYAIDVPEIIGTAFYGKGEPSGSPLIPGLTKYYNKALANPYPADADRAKRLLAEAGYPSGFNLEITVPSNYTMHIDTAQVAVNQLAKVGINATIKLVDWATWYSDAYRGRKFEATIISFDAANVSPRTFLSRYRSDGSSNLINFKNADYDRAFDGALLEVDEGRRAALYQEAQKIISDNAASVFIQDIQSFRAFPKGRYSGVVQYPLYVLDFSTIQRK